MKKYLDVFTGEVKAGDRNCILTTYAIGSCIVVTAHDPFAKVGAMAHIMLPGKAPQKEKNKFKYAEDAINFLRAQLLKLGATLDKLEICLIGGGNVLKRDDSKVCEDNIKSTRKVLSDIGLAVYATALGGTIRRTARFEIASGKVFYTEDGSEEKLLWGFNKGD